MSEPATTVVFVCEDCGRDIISLGVHDGIQVCAVCRYIRLYPDLPDDVKAKLLGND